MPAEHPNNPPSGGKNPGFEQARFIVFGGARTGSNMLVSALNSSPEITCFGELFRFLDDSINFGVLGYDKDNLDDLELRNHDFSAFLNQRIFVKRPDVSAVGFKIHYSHFFGFPGLREWLIEHHDIRVLHLRRRNLLRMLVSTEIAKTTGEWIDPVPPSILQSIRHPARSITRLLQRKPVDQEPQREPLKLSVQECSEFFLKTEMLIKQYDEVFYEHRVHTLFYEDLLEDLRGTLDSAQEFLGVTPRSLNIGTKRQNVEPLETLISNYSELQAEYKGTPCEPFFD